MCSTGCGCVVPAEAHPKYRLRVCSTGRGCAVWAAGVQDRLRVCGTEMKLWT